MRSWGIKVVLADKNRSGKQARAVTLQAQLKSLKDHAESAGCASVSFKIARPMTQRNARWPTSAVCHILMSKVRRSSNR